MGKKAAPVEFSEDICLAVCGHISLGLSLRKIEAIDGMPTKSAVMMWLLQGEAFKAAGDVKNPKALFVDQYARAREVQADSLADDIITIADECQYDTITEDGKTITNISISSAIGCGSMPANGWQASFALRSTAKSWRSAETLISRLSTSLH